MSRLRRIDWDERRSAAENARRELPKLALSYFDYVREQLADDPAPPRLHRLRLATKKLRYTLELFRPCYGPGLEARLEALQKVQKRLGQVNDCVTAQALLETAMKPSLRRDHMEKFLRRRVRKQARACRKEWKENFEAAGREEWWTAFLAHPTAGAVRERTLEAGKQGVALPESAVQA